MSYAELIAIGTPSFIAFGVFSLPAGWLADRWSRRNMMALFYVGCGLSLLAAAARAEPRRACGRAVRARHVRGDLSSRRHRDADRAATSRGRSLAFNGVCGNLGVALAAGITALLIYAFGWRGAFLVPARGRASRPAVVYLRLVPDDRRSAGARASAPDVAFAPWLAVTIFGLFMIIALSAGLVFHIADGGAAEDRGRADRRGHLAGRWSAGWRLRSSCAARWRSSRSAGWSSAFPLYLLFAAVALLQFVGVAWAAYATGTML